MGAVETTRRAATVPTMEADRLTRCAPRLAPQQKENLVQGPTLEGVRGVTLPDLMHCCHRAIIMMPGRGRLCHRAAARRRTTTVGRVVGGPPLDATPGWHATGALPIFCIPDVWHGRVHTAIRTRYLSEIENVRTHLLVFWLSFVLDPLAVTSPASTSPYRRPRCRHCSVHSPPCSLIFSLSLRVPLHILAHHDARCRAVCPPAVE